VLDFDLAAAVQECSGKQFGEAACPFPDWRSDRAFALLSGKCTLRLLRFDDRGARGD
jgi:hypothetical protein